MEWRKSQTAEERFWSKVRKGEPEECWLWTHATTDKGYGCFRLTKVGPTRGRLVKAHRFSWEIANGPIADGLDVLHRCDNPPCVNPTHLFLGTNRDNVRDMYRKGRNAPLPRFYGEDHHSARFTAEQVLVVRAEYRRGDKRFGAKPLARKYGVHESVITAIVRRKTWKHVEERAL